MAAPHGLSVTWAECGTAPSSLWLMALSAWPLVLPTQLLPQHRTTVALARAPARGSLCVCPSGAQAQGQGPAGMWGQ